MKRVKQYYIFIILILVVIVACKEKFLEVKPTGSVPDKDLANKKGIEGLVIGTYSVLTGRSYDFFSGSTNWFWGSILGGDSNKGTTSGDQSQMNEVQRYATQSTNTSLLVKYRTSYEGVVRANNSLAALAKASEIIDEADRKRLEGEARFLRAHYYFDLKKLFNNTPYIDEKTEIAAVVKNDMDLWPKIEADFQFGYDNLPETQNEVGRANKWAAGAYLAKTFLFQKKYADAKKVLDNVIKKGQTAGGLKYGLMEKFGDLFKYPTCENNKESVFAIQAAVGTGSSANSNSDFILNNPAYGGPAGCCGFNVPSFDLVNSFRTDANGLPLLDGRYNEEGNAVKSDMGVKASEEFTPDQGNLDARLDHSVGRRGIPYWNWGDYPGAAWIRDQSYAGPYAPKKFVHSKGDETDHSTWNLTTGNNFPIIRFADVLLMAAEAEVELGDLETARGYVNQVRERASNQVGFVKRGDGTAAAKYVVRTYDAPWTDPVSARAAVRFERKLELSGEGHRFFDLVRWSIAKTVLDALVANERKKLAVAYGGANFTPGRSEYQPIPQQEIDLVGTDNLIQNPGY